MISLKQIQELQAKARALGYQVTLYYDEAGSMDGMYLAHNGFGRIYDPLSGAEQLQQLIAQA